MLAILLLLKLFIKICFPGSKVFILIFATACFSVNLRSDNNGTINPPVMTITYATVSTSDEDPVSISTFCLPFF